MADTRLIQSRYRLLDLIGRGGMGEVWRARDESLGRDLAIKILPPEVTHDPKRVERFVREARAASALNHPHLLTVYDIGADPVHYIAMELVHGRTLRSVLEEGRPDTKRALEWIGQVATIQQLTSSGNTIDAVISPDGRDLAHIEAVGDVFEVYEIEGHAAWVEKTWRTSDGEESHALALAPDEMDLA